jgi:hypothetical protein
VCHGDDRSGRYGRPALTLGSGWASYGHGLIMRAEFVKAKVEVIPCGGHGSLAMGPAWGSNEPVLPARRALRHPQILITRRRAAISQALKVWWRRASSGGRAGGSGR